MVGLLSGLFNVTVCVVFPIAIFLIIFRKNGVLPQGRPIICVPVGVSPVL